MFTDISLETFLECHKLSLEVHGKQREIAHNTTKLVEDIKKMAIHEARQIIYTITETVTPSLLTRL